MKLDHNDCSMLPECCIILIRCHSTYANIYHDKLHLECRPGPRMSLKNSHDDQKGVVFDVEECALERDERHWQKDGGKSDKAHWTRRDLGNLA